MQIANFFKSLVMPLRMAKYRFMSALIGVLIFVLSTYLLAIPYGNFIRKSVPEYKSQYNFLALQEIDESLDAHPENLVVLQELVALECKVNEEFKLTCNQDIEGNIFDREIVFSENGITKKIKIVLDLKEEPTYPLKSAFKLEDYPYVENTEQYFLIFNRDKLFYQAHQEGIEKQEIKHHDNALTMFALVFDYQKYFPDFTLTFDEAETKMIGTYVVDQLLYAYGEYAASQSFINTFLITFIFPLFMVFIFWLFFKKTGRLTKFKEYYNIAAIASIVPLLLTFSVAWLFPKILDWYIFIFSLYYLFVLYKINNTPDLVD